MRYHGGKNPHLSWMPEKEHPIVVMSPVVKSREGADFTFGARWALVQYHPWKQRGKFLEMGDDEVRDYFRWWVDSVSCPRYLKDQYYSENDWNLRVPGP